MTKRRRKVLDPDQLESLANALLDTDESLTEGLETIGLDPDDYSGRHKAIAQQLARELQVFYKQDYGWIAE